MYAAATALYIVIIPIMKVFPIKIFRFFSLLKLVIFSTLIDEDIYTASSHKMSIFLGMCERQRIFVLDTWLVPHAWVNPSMIFDPEDGEKIVMVWRMPNTVRRLNIFPVISVTFNYLIEKTG